MSTGKCVAADLIGDELSTPLYFGDWLKRRRKILDLTQNELAERASCSVFALRKIEAGERRPSKQLAACLIEALEIPPEEQANFIKAARGELAVDRLHSIALVRANKTPVPQVMTARPIHLPFQPSTLIGRVVELAVLRKLLSEPHCRLLTITGLGGIGKTRLAIELASSLQSMFPGGIYYVPLESLNSPDFIVPTIGEAIELSFSATANPQEQLFNRLTYLARRPLLLVLDNLEHLLAHPFAIAGSDDITLLLSNLLHKLPNLKILATSRERSNLQEEWIFELQGLPVPVSGQTDGLEDYSSIALFLQRARQQKVDFDLLPGDRLALVHVCQLVEGVPLAIELAAAWVGMLSVDEIAQEIVSNLDFLTTQMRNVPERHRSLKAVFSHSWNLLSEEERSVLCRLAVFRGGFQRQAANVVTGATLPVLMALLSKSILQNRGAGRYDLHALIRQCAFEKLQDSGFVEDTCKKHLAYYVTLANEAQDGLRSDHLAEWLNRLEQEHNNIRAALEWAFAPSAPHEMVEQGICLLTAIDRFWAARGHIREAITWIERGLSRCTQNCLARAQALRFAGWLYNHIEDSLTAIRYLEESLSISYQLNNEPWQAHALDTLGDIGWRFGDFDKAKEYYSKSLELYRKGGDARRIGLSLASSGRMHVDCGHYQEAEILLTEGLSLLQQISDLRGCGWCFNALARLAFFQGEIQLAENRFCQALQVNYQLGYMIDISDGLHSLAIINAIKGDENRATILRAAATTIQKRIGFTYPENDPIFHKAPISWIQSATSKPQWVEGELMSTDQAVAYALNGEVG